MVIIMEVAGTMVEPATGRVHQSGWVKRVHKIGEREFGIFAVDDLSPAFVVDDPGDDAWIAAVLSNKQLELALKLLLLFSVRQDSLDCAVVECATLRRSEGRHVLDEHQAELVAGLVEQSRLYFDLYTYLVKQ
jgi:hypothetical protein